MCSTDTLTCRSVGPAARILDFAAYPTSLAVLAVVDLLALFFAYGPALAGLRRIASDTASTTVDPSASYLAHVGALRAAFWSRSHMRVGLAFLLGALIVAVYLDLVLTVFGTFALVHLLFVCRVVSVSGPVSSSPAACALCLPSSSVLSFPFC